MNEKRVKYLRAIEPVSENTPITDTDVVDNKMQFADVYYGTICGFCEHNGEINAIIEDEKTGKFLAFGLNEITIDK